MTLKEIMAAADEYAAEAFALGVAGKTLENKTMAARRAELESAIAALIEAASNQTKEQSC